jgi:predicted amidohydrolase
MTKQKEKPHIALVSMRPEIGKKEKNIEKMINFISKEEADLYVFGEAPVTGYRCKDELFRLAEPIDGPTITKLQHIASEKNASIIFGLPIHHPRYKGVIHNSAILIHSDERVESYQKWFLPTFGPFEEKIYFDEGEHLPIFTTSFGTIGICICYDLFFPELMKAYAMKGVDMIICISASPNTSRKLFETLIPARAIENTVFFIFTNIVGSQEDLVFWGGSQIYDPLGNQLIKAPYFEESIITATLDLSELPLIRQQRPTLRDTRSSLFHELYQISKQQSTDHSSKISISNNDEQ